MKRFSYILSLLCVLLSSCTDLIETFTEGEIEKGEKVQFTTMVPEIPTTRSARGDWETKVGAYKAVQEEYTFNVSMYKEGVSAPFATAQYAPISSVDSYGNFTYNGDGTLDLKSENAIYWQDNVNRWGFKAESVSSDEIEIDQSTKEKWLYQDKLVGYSYLPVWVGDKDDGNETDDITTINYRTSKQWYADNKTATELSGLMVESNDDYKKIPLYMQHQRAWVTIILKADEGVSREALAYATSEANIKTTIYSYKDGDAQPTAITKAWSREEFVDYVSDKNGDAAEHVSTTRYDAIVEPHNFIASKESQDNDIIARINVSNQNFSFAASNDFNYNKFISNGEGTEEAKEAMKAYNLEAGKHLVITATLSRKSRMIMITAWVEDWTETVTQTVCDDYGQNGSPILINNRDQLIEFLTDPDKNKPGNVGLVVPNALPLTGGEWNFEEYDLRATLNLAGARLSIDKQFLNKVERTGSIVNGEFIVSDVFSNDAAIANVNDGTIERVRLTTTGENTTAVANKAGIVVLNHGTVYQCSSALPVYGTRGYVGGIAAQSLYDLEQGTIPGIELCTVTARVDGSDAVTAGGGIVGQAEGRVSNNTFEYGITLSQNGAKFQNIIASVEGERGLTIHSNNSWPIEGNYTINGTSILMTNNYLGQKYSAVIDRQSELKKLLTESVYNQGSKIYRIAGSFDVNKDAEGSNWVWNTSSLNVDYFKNVDAIGSVKFKLDGNGKTITLTGTTNATMLFANVTGEIYNLNLVLDKPIVADRITVPVNGVDQDTNGDAIAALAYAITGTGKIRNITLKGAGGVYIESSTPAGIAVWISEGGTISNCASDIPVRLDVTIKSQDTRRYAGGIVACAQVGTITQCKYYNDAPTAISWANDNAKSPTCNYGGIVGGTSEIAGAQHAPLLEITDCSSWWVLPTFSDEETERPTMGSLMGTTCYNTDMVVHNAMAEGNVNVGNWWNGNKGAGKYAEGITELMAIGHKNSVPPTKPKDW